MESISKTFSAVDRSSEVEIRKGQTLNYIVDLSGDFTGTLRLQRRIGSGEAWQSIATITADVTGTTIDPGEGHYSLLLEGTVAGTAACTLTAVAALIESFLDTQGNPVMSVYEDRVETSGLTSYTTLSAGTKAGATVSVSERGNGIIHQTVLTLTATPIVLTDDAGVGQYGGVKLYDFPAGTIHIIGAVIDADIVLTETQWTDAAEGDVGLGTVVTAAGDALSTTRQNIIATTAIAAMTAQAGPINAQSVAAVTIPVAGTTDADLFINIRIDDQAAHITGGGFITGTVTFSWINLGDF